MSEPYVGEIKMFAGGFAPRGWALCDGQLLSVSQNDALFSLLGTIYGGDGRTTFGLPELRGRVPIHWGTGPGLTPRRLGEKAGLENVTLTVNQIPSHTHAMAASTEAARTRSAEGLVPAEASGDVYSTDLSAVNMSTQMVTNTGGGQSHTNLMPFLCVNFIVALFGVYPSRS